MSERIKLRQMLAGEGILVAPGVFDAMSARLAEVTGFHLLHMTGYGTAGGRFALPDLGLITLTEMVESAWAITSAVDLPLICDADTGYGDVTNVVRAVQEFEKAGAAGIHIQDKTWPLSKNARSHLLSIEEMADKIRAAVEARRDQDFVLIARTDARIFSSVNEAIERGNAYSEAGADMIFVEEPRSKVELEQIAAGIGAPQMINLCERGVTPFLNFRELEAMHFKLVIYPLSALTAAAHAILKTFRELKDHGTTEALWDTMISEHEFNLLMGWEKVEALQRRFGLAATD